MEKLQLPDTTGASSRNISNSHRPTSDAVRQAISLIYCSYKDDPRLTDDLMHMVDAAFHDCSVDELTAMVSPTEGLAARCQWPPTLYDIATFRKQRRDKIADREDFDRRYPRRRTAQHEPAPDPQEIARRKQQVIDALGYDPAKPKQYQRLPLDKATQKKIDDGTWSIDDLKTPAKPASEELKRNIAAKFDWRSP